VTLSPGGLGGNTFVFSTGSDKDTILDFGRGRTAPKR
jgi:hypothetical protein